MTEFDKNGRRSRGGRQIDGISCAGALLLFLLFASIMSTLIDGRNDGDSVQSASAIDAGQLVAAVIMTEQPLQPATATSLPTATSTATEIPTLTPTNVPTDTPTSEPTSTATSSPTLTPTATATETPSPVPTATFTPTPTSTPVPLPTPVGPYSWTLKVPILMYHYISVPPEDADEYRIDLSVTPANFREQMRYLAENGFNAVDFYDLSLAITNKAELPVNPVIITIDDGYRDNYENAFPILREFGLTATIFIATEFIDLGYAPYMTWPMIEEMAAAGIRFEPHSKTHVDLRGQGRDHLIYELLGSQETLAAHVGYTPRYFAYPSGRYDEDVIQILKELDYWGAVTTMPGSWHGFTDRYEWPRLRVRGNTPLAEFVALVDPGDTLYGKPIENQ